MKWILRTGGALLIAAAAVGAIASPASAMPVSGEYRYCPTISIAGVAVLTGDEMCQQQREFSSLQLSEMILFQSMPVSQDPKQPNGGELGYRRFRGSAQVSSVCGSLVGASQQPVCVAYRRTPKGGWSPFTLGSEGIITVKPLTRGWHSAYSPSRGKFKLKTSALEALCASAPHRFSNCVISGQVKRTNSLPTIPTPQVGNEVPTPLTSVS